MTRRINEVTNMLLILAIFAFCCVATPALLSLT